MKVAQERDTLIPPLERPHWLVNAGFRDIVVFSRKLMFSVHGREDIPVGAFDVTGTDLQEILPHMFTDIGFQHGIQLLDHLLGHFEEEPIPFRQRHLLGHRA